MVDLTLAGEVHPADDCTSIVVYGGEMDSTCVDSDGSTDDSVEVEPSAFAYAESSCDLEYEKLPHLMGRSAIPTFTLRPKKGLVRFSENFEYFADSDETPGIWDCLIYAMADNPACA